MLEAPAEAAGPTEASAPDPQPTLELVLDPDTAQRLSRHAAVAAARAGRARGRAVQLVWHDTPDGALANDGLALACAGGRRPVWTLSRVMPRADEPVRPGAAAQRMAEATDRAELGLEPRGTLVPLAAFEGRRADTPLAIGPDGLTLSLISGELRAVAARRAVARLRIEGDSTEAHRLALILAQDLPLVPAVVDLAEEARALARGEAPRPRRLGAPALPRGLSVGDAFAFVLGHLADVLAVWAPSARAGDGPDGVHQMRVALRRLRYAIRVFGKALACEAVADLDARLKQLGATLGPARDWDVFLAGAGADIAAALPEKPVIALLQDARSRRAGAYRDLARTLDGPLFRQTVIAAAALAATKPWPAEPAAEPVRDFAVRVLGKRHRRMVDHGADIASWPDEALHALRLDGKRLRYAAEFFASLFGGKEPRRFLKRLAVLQEALGVVNDGAVAGDLMARVPAGGSARAFAQGAVRGLVAARAVSARSAAYAAWRDFLEKEPFWE